jgi:hypothetical protein
VEKRGGGMGGGKRQRRRGLAGRQAASQAGEVAVRRVEEERKGRDWSGRKPPHMSCRVAEDGQWAQVLCFGWSWSGLLLVHDLNGKLSNCEPSSTSTHYFKISNNKSTVLILEAVAE